VKTGRLLKFRGPLGEVQAYLYHDAGRHYATIYANRSGQDEESSAVTLSADDEAAIEHAVRSWVAKNATPEHDESI
jgi:hypothetical protein